MIGVEHISGQKVKKNDALMLALSLKYL